MRDPRMSRRLSQAPRMSLVWTAINIDNTLIDDGEGSNMADEQDTSKRGSLRDFCCNHVKSIATIVMIFAMIFCVVMIVMVHKWKYETNEAAYVSECHDIAIIGAGISGTYTAWKLRHFDQDIHVYEMSDRVGGMFHTIHNSSAFPDLYLDTGVMSFNPEQQSLLNRTIHAMQQELHAYRPQNRDPPRPTYYFRGSHLTSLVNHVPYNLMPREKYKAPPQLQKHLLMDELDNTTYPNVLFVQPTDGMPLHEQRYLLKDELDNNTYLNALVWRTKDGMPLHKQGYQNVMGRVASNGAMNFLQDASPWRHLVSNDNAALLSSIPLEVKDNRAGQRLISGGMQQIPQGLLKEFLNSRHGRHEFTPFRRLACIRHKHGVYQLIFIKTYRKNGKMVDHRDSEEKCAKKIVLAIPPEAVRDLEWLPYSEMTLYKEILNSVQAYPVLRAFFIYGEKWWRGAEPPYKDVYTDLPIRHFKYLGTYNNSNKVPHYVFMTAEVDGADLPYLQHLLNLRAFDGKSVYYCNKTKYLQDEITRHIATLFDVDVDKIPTPHDVLIQDWSQDVTTGSWYVWKSGVQWDEVAKNITKPVDNENVFVVGNGFCGGLCQLNVDGALQTVDEVVERYLMTDDK